MGRWNDVFCYVPDKSPSKIIVVIVLWGMAHITIKILWGMEYFHIKNLWGMEKITIFAP